MSYITHTFVYICLISHTCLCPYVLYYTHVCVRHTPVSLYFISHTYQCLSHSLYHMSPNLITHTYHKVYTHRHTHISVISHTYQCLCLYILRDSHIRAIHTSVSDPILCLYILYLTHIYVRFIAVSAHLISRCVWTSYIRYMCRKCLCVFRHRYVNRSGMWISQGTYTQISYITHISECMCLHAYIMSHVWMSHVTHINESCHI